MECEETEIIAFFGLYLWYHIVAMEYCLFPVQSGPKCSKYGFVLLPCTHIFDLHEGCMCPENFPGYMTMSPDLYQCYIFGLEQNWGGSTPLPTLSTTKYRDICYGALHSNSDHMPEWREIAVHRCYQALLTPINFHFRVKLASQRASWRYWWRYSIFWSPKSSECQHKIAAARAARGVEPPHFLLTSFLGYVRTWFKPCIGHCDFLISSWRPFALAFIWAETHAHLADPQ